MPSAAPEPSEPTSSLRKPRGAGGSGRSSPFAGQAQQQNSVSYNTGSGSRSSTPLSSASAVGGQSNPYSQKSANEDFFAGLGAANSTRSADLPPSQGGRYTGFGSSPMPSPGAGNSSHPSAMLSSKALPTLNDIQNDPLKALGKGWGLFSSTVAQATKTINESVIQPGMQRAQDPNLQSSLYGYVQSATTLVGEGAKRGGEYLGEGLRAGSGYARQQGLDVGDLGAGYIDRFAGSGNGHTYGGYSQASGQTSLESQEAGRADLPEEDFFEAQLGTGTAAKPTAVEQAMAGMSLNAPSQPVSGRKSPLGRKGLGAQKAPSMAKKTDDDDDWGKFD